MANDISDGSIIGCSQRCRPRESDSPSLWDDRILLQVCEGRAEKRPRDQSRTCGIAVGSTTT